MMCMRAIYPGAIRRDGLCRMIPLGLIAFGCLK